MFRSIVAHYNFRVWLAGLVISNLGVWMQRTAQDWIVLTELTDHNATMVGVATALQFAPQILLVSVTGALADRVDKRKLLAITQSIMALLALLLTALAAFGVLELWMLLILALALGIANSFDIPARQAFVVEIVDKQNLTNAVSLNSAGFNVARLIGPGAAGLLVAATGATWVFAFNALSFIAVLAALGMIRVSEMLPIERKDEGKDKFRQGLRYLRTRPELIVTMVAMFVFGAFGMQTPLVVATMTSLEFDAEAGAFGILNSMFALGALGGALLVARFRSIRMGHFIGAGLFIFVSNVVAAVSPSIWFYGVVLVFSGLGVMVLVSAAMAFVQSSVEGAYLGRVLAIQSALFIGATPIGAPVVGGVTDAFGPRIGTLVTAGSGVTVAILIGLWIVIAQGARIRRDPDRTWRLRVTFPDKATGAEAPEIASSEADQQR